MYAKGQGVPQSDSEAAQWFLKAAEKGYEPARRAYELLGQ
jgi:TPR repeat protein